MSYFDQASLVMIPSGYKTSKVYSVKPTDGSGDLAFTRSNDTATRVGPDGLIEKVRTNLATYSNEFSNAAWSKVTTTVTAGQADPLGGTSAFRLLNTSAGGFVLQSGITITGSLMTASVWVKSNTASTQTMLITANSGSEQSPAISVTTSWQRVSWSFTSSGNSNILFAYNASTALDILAYGFQLEVGDVMTDYIATTSAVVSVGPVANVPRLDYLNSSCPRLLLEPQRTNLALYSEQPNNAAWTKRNSTISANSATSPDGYTNADKIQEDTTNDRHDIYEDFSVTSGTTYTISAFVKAAERTFCFLSFGSSNVNPNNAFFNLSTGAVVSSPAGVTSTITSYGNGWYRITSTATASGTGLAYVVNGPTLNASGISYQGVSGSGILVYGYAAEAGAYATSYIPTLGAAVTRGADAASKTGISSLIGQTAGTIFVDFVWNGLQSPAAVDAAIFSIGVQEYGTSNITIANYNGTMYARVTNGVTSEAAFNFGSLVAGTRYKAALAYANNDVVFYVNGVNYGSDTSASIPATGDVNFQNAYPNAKSVNQALLFKTRLSNADLAALTA